MGMFDFLNKPAGEEKPSLAVKITKENFEEEVLKSEKTVLIDFWASWCMPCRMLAPTLEEIAAERPDVKVCKVNTDEQQELAIQFGITGIPALFVIKDGQVVNQTVGVQPKENLLALL